MREQPPRPPLTQRLPHGVRTALTWCAAAAFVPLLYAVTLADSESLLPVGPVHAGFAAAMAFPLVWARRRPCAVLVVLLAELLAAVAAAQPGERVWPLLPMAGLLVCFVTATRSPRTGLVTAAVTLIVEEAAWHGALLSQGSRVFAPGFLALSVLLGLGVAVAWTAGTVLRQRREYAQALRTQAALQTATAERMRIARELHDMVAHSIGVIAIQAGAGVRVIDNRPEQAREALGVIEEASRQTLRGLRHLLGVLREPGPAAEPAPPAGLADLDRLAGTTAAAVRVEVRRRGRPRPLLAAVDRCAFRIVQESLTNVVRHAGARHCQVVLDYAPGELRIDITDDGHGAATPASTDDGHGAATPASTGGGYGIAGMRERAALLHGSLSAGPLPEGGFRVTATLPLPAASAQTASAQASSQTDSPTAHREAR